MGLFLLMRYKVWNFIKKHSFHMDLSFFFSSVFDDLISWLPDAMKRFLSSNITTYMHIPVIIWPDLSLFHISWIKTFVYAILGLTHKVFHSWTLFRASCQVEGHKRDWLLFADPVIGIWCSWLSHLIHLFHLHYCSINNLFIAPWLPSCISIS